MYGGLAFNTHSDILKQHQKKGESHTTFCKHSLPFKFKAKLRVSVKSKLVIKFKKQEKKFKGLFQNLTSSEFGGS